MDLGRLDALRIYETSNTYILDPNLIQGFGDLDLLRCIEESSRKLLALAQGPIYDLGIRQIA